jgi:hypothetical protein
MTQYVEELHEHSTLADLGRLDQITLRRPARTIEFDGLTRLAAAEDGNTLFIVGGDQSVELSDFPCDPSKEKVILGEIESLTYTTAKHHLGAEDKKPGPYIHMLAEEGGIRPMLAYDTRNARMELIGGTYHIDLDMDDGKYSAGIRD